MPPRATAHRHHVHEPPAPASYVTLGLVRPPPHPRCTRLLCFGSRTWKHRALIRAALVWFKAQGGKTVIHGAARGADTLAAQEARRLGLEVLPFPVPDLEWRLHGKRAGHLRNQRMLDESTPDFAIGFVSGSEGAPLTKGLADMHKRLARARVPTVVLREP